MFMLTRVPSAWPVATISAYSSRMVSIINMPIKVKCMYNVGVMHLWAGHVARMGEKRGCIGSWCGNRRERDHWGDLGVDGWIILGWISRSGMWVCGLDWVGPG